MFRWKKLSIPRFYGLNKKTNIVDVNDGISLDAYNVFQKFDGVITKRRGSAVMFANDEEDSSKRIDELGSARINGTKYYFKFVDGKFRYATTLSGAVTTLSPSPAIAIGEQIWWAVMNDRLYFVDGTNVLRYFDGAAIANALVYSRPTVAPTTGGAGTGFDYTYTVDNGNGESPACSTPLVNKGSAITIDIAENTGPQSIAVGDTVRIYSRATTVASGFVLVATHVWTAPNDVANAAAIPTIAITDELPQLYTEQGEALNQTAPTGLVGLVAHYGRLIGWKDEKVYCAKVTNPNSFPPEDAVNEAFVYSFGVGDGEPITRCVSFRESLFVMKRSKIAVFAGIGPDDTGNGAFAFRRLETNGIGCIAPKSAAIIGDEGSNLLIFLSVDGFYGTDGANPQRVGELIEGEIQGVSESILELSTAFYHKWDGFYYCFVGSDANKTCWIYDARKDEGAVVGWFQFDDVNAVTAAWDDDRYIFGRSDGVCASERITDTNSDFSDASVEFVDPTAVDTGTEIITVANDYATETALIARSAGTLPAPLVNGTTYFAIRMSATTIKLATSAANAALGTAINLTTTGTGDFTLVSQSAISAYYTTNWMKFKDAALVKKVLKPCILLNARSSSIALTMTTAYDWVESFADPHQITVTSSHLWGQGTWGSFIWGEGAVAVTKNIAIARRKFRSIRYKFENDELNQGFDLLGLSQEFDYIRNRGELSS